MGKAEIYALKNKKNIRIKFLVGLTMNKIKPVNFFQDGSN